VSGEKFKDGFRRRTSVTTDLKWLIRDLLGNTAVVVYKRVKIDISTEREDEKYVEVTACIILEKSRSKLVCAL
jgi:hypothetical protein